MIIRLAMRLTGVFCLIFALIPLVLYGILNTGVIALFFMSAALLGLPVVWYTALAPFHKLRACILMTGCVALVFCLFVSLLMVRRGWWNPPVDTGKTAVIVLGSKINGDQPSLMLGRRLNVARDYLGRNPDAFCVVSGGQGDDEDYPEALVMRNYLINQGIDNARIRMEDASTNTRENLRFSGALLDGDEQVVLVTDGFHQLRASVFASAEGLRTTNASAKTPWGLFPAYWMREILGVSWAYVSVNLFQ